jgi:hypothetical protein
VSVDDLIEHDYDLARWMRETSVVLHEAGLEDVARDMVVRAAGLERKASWALSAPPDESRVGGGWIDQLYDSLKMPWQTPTRRQVVWLVEWARRARSVVRHMVGVAESYNEPAQRIATAQRVLDEIDIGPDPNAR